MNVTFESSDSTFSPYEPHLANLYNDITTKIIASVIHTAIQVGGGFLWFGIAHFEKFGGDPKKRCISNFLSTFATFTIIFGLTLTLLTYIFRILSGAERAKRAERL